MDNIRACIETFFLQINSATILSYLRSNKRCSDTFGIDEDMFCQKFMVDNKCCTLDQVHELFQLFRTEWIRWPLSHERQSHTDNLFHILLHYTQNILVEQDGEPVCRYSQLLRWRMLAYKLGEDMLTTAFLAFKDSLERHGRKDFYWHPIIKQDNPAINHLLSKGVTDLHFHLRGSSLNYELNWIALMNQVRNRRLVFSKLRKCLSYRISTLDNEKWDTFYLSTIKACFIRYYLFCILIGDKFEDDYKKYIFANDDVSIQSDIQNLINVRRYGKRNVLDYATPNPPYGHDHSSVDLLLSGERMILYSMFRRIYLGDSSYEEQVLFYVYLLQKAQIRRELIQLNETEGFCNFSDYEYRKEFFFEGNKIYQNLVPKLAVDTAFSQGNLKYLECRITPKKSSNELRRAINTLDRQICRKQYDETQRKNYFYILHFIKMRDESSCEFSKGMDMPIKYRHYSLRHDIKQQAMATLEALNNSPKLRDRIVGIDAANTELYCRPEVFGPVYRYMKRFDCKYSQKARSLRYTFHVGEDFWDITDGLRAIDEAILFLNLDCNDRLGHALALGTDVNTYYRLRNKRVVLSKQNAMDNAMWLTIKAKELGIILSTNVALELRRTFDMYYDEIYLSGIQERNGVYMETDASNFIIQQGKDMYVYYLSWLLRGDDPEVMRSHNQYETLWNLTARNQWNENVIQARTHHVALKLFDLYHYDKQVRCRGNEKCEVKIMPEIITLIEQIQHRMCHQIASLHIGIEANITSNKFIGNMNKYIQHPIGKLYQLGLSKEYENINCPQMSVSVNTDDKGIFDTSIEDEYALLALALEKEIDRDNNPRYQPRYVYEWLNNIRKIGFEQQFRKQDASKYE